MLNSGLDIIIPIFADLRLTRVDIHVFFVAGP